MSREIIMQRLANERAAKKLARWGEKFLANEEAVKIIDTIELNESWLKTHEEINDPNNKYRGYQSYPFWRIDEPWNSLSTEEQAERLVEQQIILHKMLDSYK